MVATLGGQPQLITFALDALLQRGEPIVEVVVLYLGRNSPRINSSLTKLAQEFVGDVYTHGNYPCRFRVVKVQHHLSPLTDIQTETEAHAAFEMLQDLVVSLKNEGYGLHVCVSGGRRMLALLLTTIAQTSFRHGDRLWHIYTPEKTIEQVKDGAMMHVAPTDGVRLLPVPIVLLGVYMANTQSPPQTHYSRQLLPDQRQQCQAVLAILTGRETETLRHFVQGLKPQEVAGAMHLSINTVNSHRRNIGDKCREHWPDHTGQISYHQLRQWFEGFFEFEAV